MIFAELLHERKDIAVVIVFVETRRGPVVRGIIVAVCMARLGIGREVQVQKAIQYVSVRGAKEYVLVAVRRAHGGWRRARIVTEQLRHVVSDVAVAVEDDVRTQEMAFQNERRGSLLVLLLDVRCRARDDRRVVRGDDRRQWIRADHHRAFLVVVMELVAFLVRCVLTVAVRCRRLVERGVSLDRRLRNVHIDGLELFGHDDVHQIVDHFLGLVDY